jgi:hypothetical protein
LANIPNLLDRCAITPVVLATVRGRQRLGSPCGAEIRSIKLFYTRPIVV